MPDNFSKDKRSSIMRAVKSRGNISTELRLVQIFKESGIKGWRRGYNLYGNPDFAFPKKRIAVFADGCFWHGHGCRNVAPKDNAYYWKEKIRKNKLRDNIVSKTLRQKGWRVVRIWECEIKNESLEKLKPLL